MKNEFIWYFKPSEDEIKSIWEKGILTVDANVLLDLYRYHESTRNSLISSLKSFDQRLWLTHQAAEEFIKNRTKVIVSSEKTFNDAKKEVTKLKDNFNSSISRLKGNRIIPAEITEQLLTAINPIIDKTEESISSAESKYPKYLDSDPILDELSSMFTDSVGEDFKDEELESLKKEAKERIENEIPPGYLDAGKPDDRPYGDFLLWRQILLHSKNKETPIIFVTSERKEDWWEKQSGKTIGARPELLKEANKFCGNRILIYQTDRFLEFASKQSGEDVDSKAVEEIRAIDTLRSNVETAVELIEQNDAIHTEFLHEGELHLNLHRPVKNITGSGHFDPKMNTVPIVNANLVESPTDMPRIKIRAGAGTDWNFNLHIISTEKGKLLPVGEYRIKYVAKCTEPEFESEEMSVLEPVIATDSVSS